MDDGKTASVGSFLQRRGVGCWPLAFLGEVDEATHTNIQQRVDPGDPIHTSKRRRRVFAGEQLPRNQPVAVSVRPRLRVAGRIE